jgi:hypothetical protein
MASKAVLQARDLLCMCLVRRDLGFSIQGIGSRV